MKRMIIVLLAIALLFSTASIAVAETTAKPIPFSGWVQGEEGTYWNANEFFSQTAFGQAVLCQSVDDLTVYLQANEYPIEYGEGYDEDYFAEKSLMLLEVVGGRGNDRWYVNDLIQIGSVMNCSLVAYMPAAPGPAMVYWHVLCVELTEKPIDIQRLRVTINYDHDGLRQVAPVALDFPYGANPIKYDLGDVDGNGAIGADDALLVLKSIVGKAELTETQQTAAKTNSIHTIGAEDALCILQKAVGKIDVFPIEFPTVCP